MTFHPNPPIPLPESISIYWDQNLLIVRKAIVKLFCHIVTQIYAEKSCKNLLESQVIYAETCKNLLESEVLMSKF